MCSNFEKDCKQCPALIKLFDKLPNKNYLNNKKIIKEIMPKFFYLLHLRVNLLRIQIFYQIQKLKLN